MKDIYKNKYTKSNDLELIHSTRIKVMREMIKCSGIDTDNSTVLDFGCYDGTFLSLLSPNKKNLFGIEASDYGVKSCREKSLNVKQFYLEDTTIIPFDDATFDLLVAGEIIEHIYDTDHLLEEFYRVLKQKGKLIISTPNISSLGRRLLLLVGKNPIIELSPNETDSSGHIRYFTFSTLTDLLKKHFFKVVDKRSDVVNLSGDGKLRLTTPARLLPSIGQSIIILAVKD
ncbi:class I SAM-dependent methyltransferase [Patescibacteria group bacterium]|nr:class I SAM-dependent methyltransferase [Patescibacteria group bacterium]MBU1953026.1 class I SAM-dependent methyltransferase [Patescibacteria group bacterium]